MHCVRIYCKYFSRPKPINSNNFILITRLNFKLKISLILQDMRSSKNNMSSHLAKWNRIWDLAFKIIGFTWFIQSMCSWMFFKKWNSIDVFIWRWEFNLYAVIFIGIVLSKIRNFDCLAILNCVDCLIWLKIWDYFNF